jgi:hypothetical protein
MSRTQGRDEPPSSPRYGEPLEELQVGPLRVEIKHNCIRRDLYEISLAGAFPPSTRALLAPLGAVRGGDTLFVVDVAGVHRITVAPRAGRVVVMPKLATERPAQRSAALALAARLAALLESAPR